LHDPSGHIVELNEQKPEGALVAREILAYLSEHPHAQDTLEGIVGWWLLQRQIQNQTQTVKQALGELVGRGLVVEIHAQDSQVHYRLDLTKQEEIGTLLQQQ
jgi:hypothetical protein